MPARRKAGALRNAARKAKLREALERRATLSLLAPSFSPDDREVEEAIREFHSPSSAASSTDLPGILTPKLQTDRHSTLVNPAFWRDLESRFRALQPTDPTRDLIAEWSSTGWDEGRNHWFLHGSHNPRTQKMFEALAERGALALGHKRRANAVDGWLELLKEASPNFGITGSGSGHYKNSKGKMCRYEAVMGTISRLCEASADYCVSLENHEIAFVLESAESAGSPPVSETESRRGPSRITEKGRAKAVCASLDNASTASEQRGRTRAKLVAKLIKELNALRDHMQVPDEDYPVLRDKHPEYQVFKICKSHPAAADFVKRIIYRRKPNQLAYQIAAVECGVRAATIESAWKKFKIRENTPKS